MVAIFNVSQHYEVVNCITPIFVDFADIGSHKQKRRKKYGKTRFTCHCRTSR